MVGLFRTNDSTFDMLILRGENMKKLLSVALCTFLLIGLGACTSNKIIRSTVAKSDPKKCNFKGSADLAEFTQRGRDECSRYSIENHEDFTLGVVEFDDQGWLYDRGQMDLLMEELENQTENGTEDLSIFVYVHGWKHNADFCDNNVCCFRETLKQMRKLETEYKRVYQWKKERKVFGIYVGWRGLSVMGPDVLRSTSFYSRKNAATRVALGSTRELLGKIKDFYERKNVTRGKKEVERKDVQQMPLETDDSNSLRRAGTRLLTMGHSFGGLVVYNAVAQALMESAIEPERYDQDQLVKPFGDLVFIVNPAFEGTRYEPLHQIAKRREYPGYQPPVFVAVTSQADKATRVAFPIGRWVNGVWENYSTGKEGKQVVHTPEEQREANVKTIGHAERYRTHRLEYTPSKAMDAKLEQKKSDTGECSCPYKTGIENLLAGADIDSEYDAWLDNLKNPPDWDLSTGAKKKHRVKGWTRKFSDESTLRHDPNDEQNSPDNPFWVVHTTKEIIPDHNGFYTPLFLNFVRHIYDDSLHLWGLQDSFKRR
jgi:hypothetical protein